MDLTRRLLAVVALTLVVGACEDDPVEPELDLTEEEAVALLTGATVVIGQLADTTIVPIHISQDSIVYGCPQGGQVKLVGALTEEEGDTARARADFLITPTECVVTGGGMEFTLDPGPAIRYQLLVEIYPGFPPEFNIEGTMTGGLDWELDGRMGNCEIDLTLDAQPVLDPDNPGLTGVYAGSLCGHEVEIDAADLVLVSDL